MSQSQRRLLALVLALSLLVIPAALMLYSTLGTNSMANMPGMDGGGMPTATGTGARTDRAAYAELTPAELSARLAAADVLLINVHIPYEGELDGTDRFIPYDQIAGATAQLPADRGAPIVLYCRTGRMSAEAATTLVGLGYRNVEHLAGGMEAWAAQGYPLRGRP